MDVAFNGAKPVSCSSLNSLAAVVLQIVAADLFSRQRINADQEFREPGALGCTVHRFAV